MTFDAYWQRLCDSNPNLANGAVTLTLSTHEFKRQLSKAFAAGISDIVEESKGYDFFDELMKASAKTR